MNQGANQGALKIKDRIVLAMPQIWNTYLKHEWSSSQPSALRAIIEIVM